MLCAMREKLVDEVIRAADAHHISSCHMVAAAGTPNSYFRESSELAAQNRGLWEQAKKALEQHRTDHGC
jgi:hypothetical protein